MTGSIHAPRRNLLAVTVVFDVSGRRCALSEEEASELALRLRGVEGTADAAFVVATKIEQVIEGKEGAALRLLDSEQAVLASTIGEWLEAVGPDDLPERVIDLRYALDAEHSVEFVVGHGIYPLPRSQATVVAENLRLKAAGQLGSEGVEGARELADEIEALLVGAREGAVELEGTRAYAVFSVLKASIANPASPFVSASYSLYQALRPLQK
jgi:hypothetical protein